MEIQCRNAQLRLVNGALVEAAVEIRDCLTTGDWRLANVTLGKLGELGELPHWRLVMSHLVSCLTGNWQM